MELVLIFRISTNITRAYLNALTRGLSGTFDIQTHQMKDEYVANEVLVSMFSSAFIKSTQTALSCNTLVKDIQAKFLKFQTDLFL